jgi:hypothetical protein
MTFIGRFPSFGRIDRRFAPGRAGLQAMLSQAGMQVPGTGHTSLHFGWSKKPTHSVHFFGSMTKPPRFIEIAAFGHSNSQMLQPVHCDATIL